MQFDFRRGGKKCSECETAFAPGQPFVSALMEQDDGQTVRMDFCMDDWDENELECVGFWNQTMPDLTTGKVYWAPRDVLLSYFEHLMEGDQKEVAYVMSLVLLRKKYLSAKSRFDDESGKGQIVVDRSTSRSWEVQDVEVADERIIQIQEELAQNLFSSQRADE